MPFAYSRGHTKKGIAALCSRLRGIAFADLRKHGFRLQLEDSKTIHFVRNSAFTRSSTDSCEFF